MPCGRGRIGLFICHHKKIAHTFCWKDISADAQMHLISWCSCSHTFVLNRGTSQMASRPGGHPKADGTSLRFCFAFMRRGPELLLEPSWKEKRDSQRHLQGSKERVSILLAWQDRPFESWLANGHGRHTGFYLPSHGFCSISLGREGNGASIVYPLLSLKGARYWQTLAISAGGTELFVSEWLRCLLQNVKCGWIPTASQQRVCKKTFSSPQQSAKLTFLNK